MGSRAKPLKSISSKGTTLSFGWDAWPQHQQQQRKGKVTWLGKGKVAICSFPAWWKSSPLWVLHGRGIHMPKRCSAYHKQIWRWCLLPQPSPSSRKVFPVTKRTTRMYHRGLSSGLDNLHEACCLHSRDAKLCVVLGPRATAFFFLSLFHLWEKDKKSEYPTVHQGRILIGPHYVECSGGIFSGILSSVHGIWEMLNVVYFCTMGRPRRGSWGPLEIPLPFTTSRLLAFLPPIRLLFFLCLPTGDHQSQCVEIICCSLSASSLCPIRFWKAKTMSCLTL